MRRLVQKESKYCCDRKVKHKNGYSKAKQKEDKSSSAVK